MTFPFLSFPRNLSINGLIGEERLIVDMAGKKRIFRSSLLPVFEICSFPLTEMPEVLILGLSPAKAANCLAHLKVDKSGSSVNKLTADVYPMPGILVKRLML